MQKEYCSDCRIPLEEWEWCGRGFCETCEDKITMIVRKDAEIILDLIDVSTEVNWPVVSNGMVERGHSPAEIELATKKLADLAGRSNPISKDDF